jgi:hypothetical protein
VRQAWKGQYYLVEKKVRKMPNVDAFVKVKLRRASVYWPGRTEALKRARVAPGKYQCDSCKQIFSMIKVEGVSSKTGKKKTRYKNPLEVDHIEAIVPMDGSGQRKDDVKRTDWNSWIDRAFVPPEKYSCKCHQCHSSKTELENQMRTYYKEEKRKKNAKKT